MSTINQPTSPVAEAWISACRCTDQALDELRSLIDQGIDQWNASLIAFGHTPRWDAPAAVWSAWVRHEVHTLTTALRTRLGLP